MRDPLYTDYSQQGSFDDIVICVICSGDLYREELLEYDYEWRHVDSNTVLSADGSHEAEATGL